LLNNYADWTGALWEMGPVIKAQLQIAMHHNCMLPPFLRVLVDKCVLVWPALVNIV